MERDFMGLNSREQLIVVKEEINDEIKDSGFTKGSGVHRPYMTKVPAHSHFISFKAAQEEKPQRDTFDPIQNRPLVDAQKLAGATSMQHFVGGLPVTAATPVSAGCTELWNTAKVSGSPAPTAQFTIFYAGTVNVFDNISPEQAQTIMFLAKNGCSKELGPNTFVERLNNLQSHNSKLAENDGGVIGKQSLNTPPPTSGLSSPVSVSSTNNELLQVKTTGVTVNAATMIQSAVPQARKASLARFLEKRKERVMNAAAPYEMSKKSPDCATSESNGVKANVSTANVSTRFGVGVGPALYSSENM